MAIATKHKNLVELLTETRKLRGETGAKLQSIKSEMHLMEQEFYKLGRKEDENKKEVEALAKQGIFYCGQCNNLYEKTTTRITEESRSILDAPPGTSHLSDRDLEQWRRSYACTNYHCPTCNTVIYSEQKVEPRDWEDDIKVHLVLPEDY